jgi:hypothetical protein
VSRLKVRFVIGLYGSFDDLCRAAEAIAGLGLEECRLCAIVSGGGDPAEVEALVEQRRRAKAASGSRPGYWVDWPTDGVCGCPFQHQPDHPGESDEIDPSLAVDYARWAARRLALQLTEQLQLGGALLFVRVDDDEQQVAVGSLLLRQSGNGVQTHEIRLDH